jgi:hypothetical protein
VGLRVLGVGRCLAAFGSQNQNQTPPAKQRETTGFLLSAFFIDIRHQAMAGKSNGACVRPPRRPSTHWRGPTAHGTHTPPPQLSRRQTPDAPPNTSIALQTPWTHPHPKTTPFAIVECSLSYLHPPRTPYPISTSDTGYRVFRQAGYWLVQWYRF